MSGPALRSWRFIDTDEGRGVLVGLASGRAGLRDGAWIITSVISKLNREEGWAQSQNTRYAPLEELPPDQSLPPGAHSVILGRLLSGAQADYGSIPLDVVRRRLAALAERLCRAPTAIR